MTHYVTSCPPGHHGALRPRIASVERSNMNNVVISIIRTRLDACLPKVIRLDIVTKLRKEEIVELLFVKKLD